ncbi:uncharacterized protein LOC125532806 [Triticum urartu]|uniref:uncharacterized protein LOC125532806 n=1 Tax=Triticum urartu TaxID=4572 RepID=UPI0020439F8F|nr:uncharacterized protein LOC125532806 [Triticum urartu]
MGAGRRKKAGEAEWRGRGPVASGAARWSPGEALVAGGRHGGARGATGPASRRREARSQLRRRTGARKKRKGPKPNTDWVLVSEEAQSTWVFPFLPLQEARRGVVASIRRRWPCVAAIHAPWPPTKLSPRPPRPNPSFSSSLRYPPPQTCPPPPSSCCRHGHGHRAPGAGGVVRKDHHRRIRLPRTSISSGSRTSQGRRLLLPLQPSDSDSSICSVCCYYAFHRAPLCSSVDPGQPFDQSNVTIQLLMQQLTRPTNPETDAAPVTDYISDVTSSFTTEFPVDGSQDPDETIDDYYYPEGAYYNVTPADDLE